MKRLNEIVEGLNEMHLKEKPADLLEEFRDYQQTEQLKREYEQITGFYYKTTL